MAALFQLIYISTAREGLGVGDCRAILDEARNGNARLNITGLLLFNSKRFVQVLEGAEGDVRAIYARIEADRRHHGLVVVGESSLEEREFGQWAMAFDDGESGTLSEQVETLLDRSGASTRALFTTSAKLYRSDHTL
ncbi:hypothetical protein BH10PSE12_BH10PSE12_12170 [soil metagenome]